MRTRASAACANGSVDARSFGRACLLAQVGRFGCGRVGRGDERGCLGAQLCDVAAGDDRSGRTTEPHEVAFRGGGAFRRGRELAPQHALGFAELTQCRAETRGPVGSGLPPRAERRLDDVDRPVERVERPLESAGRREQRLQRPGTGPPDAQPWRGRCERGLCLLRLLVGAGRSTLGEASLIRQRPRRCGM